MNAPRPTLWWRLVGFGFRLLYNELAWTYDWVSSSVSLGHWRRWQRASIPHLEVGSEALVLELAHGTANLQIDLAEAGITSVGLDLSRFMGQIAYRKLAREGVTRRLVRGSAPHLPFSRQQFDAVVSTFPTEFIVQATTLSEAHRVLKPGGRLVFVPNGMLTASNVIVTLLEWLYRITGQRGPWPVNLTGTFEEAGFRATMIEETLPGSKIWIVIAEKPETLMAGV